MTVLDETYALSNGVEIPKLGLGTWFIDDDRAAEAVRAAVGIGYRNIDTAQAYGNERGVGEGVRTAGVPRDELFVSTKLAAEIKDYDRAVDAIDGSLEKLGTEYIDLMLIHSPQPWDDFRGGDYAEGNRAAWRALEEAYQSGRIRSIGVSNFQQEDLENVLRDAKVVPHVNQLLVHAGNTPSQLLDYCEGKQILVEAYSPMAAQGAADPRRAGHRRLRPDPGTRVGGETTVEAIAERADVTRRTFSRHFAGKEDAALDFVRRDGDRINALLRSRPAEEPPLLAYRRAVRDWLADREEPAWHVRPRMRRLLALADNEPDCSPPTSASGSTPRRSRSASSPPGSAGTTTGTSPGRRRRRRGRGPDRRPAPVGARRRGELGTETSPPSWSGPTTP
ncbi:hypothetical protein STENM327S_03046 [Streptomyces tendae]